LGQKKTYEGTVFSNTLKVVGIDVASIGHVHPGEDDVEEIRKEKKKEGVYKKLAIQNGIIIGAIWMGTKEGFNEVSRLISYKINVERWKNSLLEDDFDFSVI
jgi:NAD(P)H-nitrite reductase large subunit